MIKEIPKEIMVEFPKNIKRFKYNLGIWVDVIEVDISNQSKKDGFSPGDTFIFGEKEYVFLGICVRTSAVGQRQQGRPVVYKEGDRAANFFDVPFDILKKTGHIDLPW